MEVGVPLSLLEPPEEVDPVLQDELAGEGVRRLELRLHVAQRPPGPLERDPCIPEAVQREHLDEVDERNPRGRVRNRQIHDRLSVDPPAVRDVLVTGEPVPQRRGSNVGQPSSLGNRMGIIPPQ